MKKKRKLDLSDQGETIQSDLFKQVTCDLGFEVKENVNSVLSDEEIQEADQFSPDILKGLKASMRIEKKGRRGKTVTLVTGLDLREDFLLSLSKHMKKALGCGASVEDGVIYLQGDNRERIAKWLENNGVRVKF